MAEDRKFFWDNELGVFRNRINGAEIPRDEPVIIFRARDVHALNTLWFYLSQVQDDHHKQAVRDRIAEFSAFRASEDARMKEPGITHDIRLNDVFAKATDHLYMSPDHAFEHHKILWDSFDTAQQLKLVQDAKARGHQTLPAWMVVRGQHEGPVAIVTAAGVHPSNLDRAIEEQRIYYKKGFGPGDGDAAVEEGPICS